MAAPDAAGFDAGAFRTGIQFAMQMGLDPETPTGVVFIMAPVIDPDDTTVDAQGVPWDPAEVGTLPEEGAEISANCAVEFFSASGVNTTGTDVEPARVLVTILDDDWLPVSGCIAIRLGDRVYRRNYKQPTMGLFSVGVHQVAFQAGDI